MIGAWGPPMMAVLSAGYNAVRDWMHKPRHVPAFVYRPLYLHLWAFVAQARPPDQAIGNNGPYMLRWWLFGTSKTLDDDGDPKPRRPFGYSFYLHCFVRSDDDRALHDHPWPFWSLLLRNGYREHTSRKLPPNHAGFSITVRHSQEFSAGTLRFNKAEALHRVELFPQYLDPSVEFNGRPALTDALFVWASLEQNMLFRNLWCREQPTWSLFVAGKWQRRWGFMCKDGWKHWRDFEHDGGCGEREDFPN